MLPSTSDASSAVVAPGIGARLGPLIRNPVLTGFHPDPSILRVGRDYYLATSTFEWVPGVTLHHSRDLVNWHLLGGALTESRLADLVGTVDSGGIWAPCLSYADGQFHLVYTHMVSNIGPYRDLRNFVITAPSPTGPWSNPVPLHNRGFDPSFFHDEDGRSWMLSMTYEHRPGRDSFGGIILQEWSRQERRLVGPVHHIFGGTGRGCVEGPHLYQRNGWYVLLLADGGTGFNHGALVARSREITGPYELDPAGPLLTTRDAPEHPLQKAGHGSLVETPEGEWYLAHLCARPIPGTDRCVMGRETALQSVEWTDDGWPCVQDGQPALSVHTVTHSAEAEAESAVTTAGYRFHDGFDAPGHAGLDPHLMTLRLHAAPDWLELTESPGHLRLRGQQSLASAHRQSLVAHRQTSLRCQAQTVVDFRPSSAQQMAGLVHIYNTQLWHYLHLTWDADLGRVLRTGSLDYQTYQEGAVIPVPGEGPVHLRADVDEATTRFSWSTDGTGWIRIGGDLDASLLSDEYATRTIAGRITNWGFTGAFLGMAVQDLTGAALHADFDHFSYHEV
ncbi:glycoside hydrolase family 43 protein [Streptomyces sp. NBC_00988]|uniref:glycoside hydrolase family 43 protein n=1 Tax=Streptomyces sp. NBC_00988 TaxID=2903704 RepID=UPI003865F3AC